MSFNPNKLTFKVDEVTGEIIQPQVLLCDRQLNKLGEIYPVNNLRIKANLNGADEVSFSTPRQSDIYDDIKDYSIIFVRGFGYFEVSPTVSDTFIESKNIQGSSLGETELSQLLCTLECNTEDDMKYSEGDIYIPTILYNPDSTEHSLIHRILSDSAPNYEVGHVDQTIRNCQRTFSFSNTDIISCFNQIAEEIGCIFDVVVEKHENGEVHRTVNIYDAQYCGECGKRNIVNGICQDCKSTDIRGIGNDTTIQISTDNLSDEITLSSDGNMKNCFIVEGGDDLMTNAIEGINPSGNNKIYMFSEKTMNSFSPELRERYKEYVKEYNSKEGEYAEIYETQCNISDLILYLQSRRMPSVETAEKTLPEEVLHVLTQFKEYFPNGLGLSGDETKDTGSRNSAIRQIFSLFLDSGYAIKQEGGEYLPDKKCWTGSLIIYEIQNNDSKATIQIKESYSEVEFSDSDYAISENLQDVLSELDTLLKTFHIPFSTDNYEAYINQRIALERKNHEYIKKNNETTPKNWREYSLNRLLSYYDGYEACKLAVRELQKESELENVQNKKLDELFNFYNNESKNISNCIKKLEDLIYYLYFYCLGEPDSSLFSSSSVPSSLGTDYTSSAYVQTSFASCEDAFIRMENYIKDGVWDNGDEPKSTDAPLYCSKCGSTSVTLTGCNICNGTVITYSNIAENVREHFQQSYKAGKKDLESQRKAIQDSLNLKKYLNDKHLGDAYYKELCSFIREDVYTNSNFISAGMETNNTKLVSHAKELLQKAHLELEKACVPQHTLTGNVYAFVAFSSLNPEDFPIQNAYDNFKLGNFLRYISDGGTVYKLRLSSEEFSWDDSGASLNVEFTDVIQYANGSFSDIESLIQHVGNLSTSFDSVKKQAEQGEKASNTFSDIKNEGLYSALGNVLNARNQDVQITEEGITLRKYDYEMDDYDRYQMKLINRNIVMTDDGWKNAKMAIGLGRYDGELKYGVWAELLVGDMIVGKELVIKNDKENSTVFIDQNGIRIGSIRDNTQGVCIELNPNKDNIFNIFRRKDNNETSNILYVNKNGDSGFKGEVNASGYSGGAVIAEEKIEFKKYYDNSDLYSYFLVGDGNSTEPVFMTVSYPNGDNFTVNQSEVNITGLDLVSDSKITANGLKITSNDCIVLNNKYPFKNGYLNGNITIKEGYVEISSNYGCHIDKCVIDDNCHIRGDCYIGDPYNYNKVEYYMGVFIYNATYSYSNCSLQKLGRIIIFSVIVTLNPGTHQAIGCIPEGYRPSHAISISADNYASFAECNIDSEGNITVSCSNPNGNPADYRIHGVWFLDADDDIKLSQI